MGYKLKAMAGIGITLLVSGRVGAQGVVMQRNLSLSMAKTIAEANSRNASRKASTPPRRWSTVPVRCW